MRQYADPCVQAKADERRSWAATLCQISMERGPVITNVSPTYRDEDQRRAIVIPTDVYNPEAPKIYGRRGFRYDKIEGGQWYRFLDEPYEGKRYSEIAWLRAARRLYRQVWPHWEPPFDVQGEEGSGESTTG